MEYELVLGLETHVELSTKTKIFCGCKAEFKVEKNTDCCPICIGLFDIMPRLNKQLVCHKNNRVLSTNCKISSY